MILIDSCAVSGPTELCELTVLTIANTDGLQSNKDSSSLQNRQRQAAQGFLEGAATLPYK